MIWSTGVTRGASRVAELGLVAAIETIMEAITSSLEGQAIAREATELINFATNIKIKVLGLPAVSLVTGIVAVCFSVTKISPRYTLTAGAAPEGVRGALRAVLLIGVVGAL